MDHLNAPSEITEEDRYRKGMIEGLTRSLTAINHARDFYRGSTYSTDSLIGMMINIIHSWVLDLSDPGRQLCEKINDE